MRGEIIVDVAFRSIDDRHVDSSSRSSGRQGRLLLLLLLAGWLAGWLSSYLGQRNIEVDPNEHVLPLQVHLLGELLHRELRFGDRRCVEEAVGEAGLSGEGP